MKPLAAICWILAALSPTRVPGEEKRVLVLTQREVTQYEAVLEGVREELAGKDVALEISDIGEGNVIQRAADSGDRPDLVLSIGTLASRAAVDGFKEQPLVFAMVLNPAKEGLGGSDRVTGVSARIDPRSYLEHARQVQPGLRRIGVVYTPELFEEYVAELKAQAGGYDIEIVDAVVHSRREFTERLRSVIKEDIDLFLILPDFTIYDAKSTRYTLIDTFKRGIPCIGPSEAFVKSGALWGLAISPGEVGRQAARIVDGVFAEQPRRPGWHYAQSNTLLLNVVTAEKLAIDLPESTLQAESVVKLGRDATTEP